MNPYVFGQLVAARTKEAADPRAMLAGTDSNAIPGQTAMVGNELASLRPAYAPSPTLDDRRYAAERLRRNLGGNAVDAYSNAVNNKREANQLHMLSAVAPVAGHVVGRATGMPMLGATAGLAGSAALTPPALARNLQQPQYNRQFQQAKQEFETAVPRQTGSQRFFRQYNEPSSSGNYPWNRK